MRNMRRLSLFHLEFITLFLLLTVTGVAWGGELPKSLNLDLSLPQEVEEPKEAVFEEKYREILQEITISTEATEIVDQIKERITGVTSVSLEFEVTQVKGKRIESVEGKLSASVQEKLARVEFFTPDALRGYIMVVDQAKMETKTFRPVVNQITVQALEDMSKEAFSALSVADVTSYFDFTIYDVELIEQVEQDGIWEYLLQVEGWKDQDLVQVKVKDDSWIPHEILLFEDSVFLGKVEFINVALNEDLSTKQLSDLPKVKEVKM